MELGIWTGSHHGIISDISTFEIDSSDGRVGRGIERVENFCSFLSENALVP
jgi:hypothetical protein